jgi:hypothetical protein
MKRGEKKNAEPSAPMSWKKFMRESKNSFEHERKHTL